jgi:hypothetical protein
MTRYLTDTAPVALTPLRPEQVRNAVRQALFDATIDGRVGSPQERLEHKSNKARNDALMVRVRKLSVTGLSSWYQRLVGGENPAAILIDLGV